MSNKGQLDDSRSIWAKPFSASTTEEKVRKVFQHLGRCVGWEVERVGLLDRLSIALKVHQHEIVCAMQGQA